MSVVVAHSPLSASWYARSIKLGFRSIHLDYARSGGFTVAGPTQGYRRSLNQCRPADVQQASLLDGAPMKLRIALIAAAATLGLAACESQADKTAENQADAIEKATENRADALENQAAATPNEARETQLNQQADAVEKAGDDKADQVEQEAGKH
ncbi:MAG TPA: hypothetical protein VGB49_08585 [Caulobacteraceae bacterium]